MRGDARWVRWAQGTEGLGANPARTIDHIFVSPGTVVAESQYLPGLDSDQPELMATIEW